MRCEELADYDQRLTVVCIASVEELAANPLEVEGRPSISWFIESVDTVEEEGLTKAVAAIVGLSPVLVHIFGEHGELVHDCLDVALHEAGQFAVTFWSTKLARNEAIFNIFRVDYPQEEDIVHWSARLIILDKQLPDADKSMMLKSLRDPDKSIRDFIARK